jgi:hypothetical protein
MLQFRYPFLMVSLLLTELIGGITIMETLGLTKAGKPRIRREKLSPHVRQVEHNVLMHIKRDVRHTGRGWMPLLLDTAWEMALKRLVRDGIVQERSDLGGYVPTEFVPAMEAEQARLLSYIKARAKVVKKPIQLRNLGRDRATALGRLVVTGALAFDPEAGYMPLD